MQLTILVDNQTLIDRYFLAEPGLSILIEDEDVTVLFDTGYSDIFIRNSIKMGKDLTCLDYVALSHGHLDHTWGLGPLIRYFTERAIENLGFKRPTLVAHPECLTGITLDGVGEIGPLVSEKELAGHVDLQLEKGPVSLGKHLIFLGEIPRENDFETFPGIGKKHGCDKPDMVPDDSALVYRSSEGLVIITGCSHAGICNIVEYAKAVCSDHRILDIVGGFHLLNPGRHRMDATAAYFKALNPGTVHACHCTDLSSRVALSAVANVKEAGVGLGLSYA